MKITKDKLRSLIRECVEKELVQEGFFSDIKDKAKQTFGLGDYKKVGEDMFNSAQLELKRLYQEFEEQNGVYKHAIKTLEYAYDIFYNHKILSESFNSFNEFSEKVFDSLKGTLYMIRLYSNQEVKKQKEVIDSLVNEQNGTKENYEKIQNLIKMFYQFHEIFKMYINFVYDVQKKFLNYGNREEALNKQTEVFSFMKEFNNEIESMKTPY